MNNTVLWVGGSVALFVALMVLLYFSGGLADPAQMDGNERTAIGTLKTIGFAQALFREGDKDGNEELDYADLDELAEAGLIDPVLGSGEKSGYHFEVRASREEPEFMWMATADPIEPGLTGTRYFVTNHEGVVYYSDEGPFEIDDSCEIPEHAIPVGR